MNGLITRSGLFDDFFKDVAPGFYVKPLHGDPLPAQIKVDVKESDGAYTVHAELPGVSKEDIQVTVEGNVVTLRAEVRQQDSQSADEMRETRGTLTERGENSPYRDRPIAESLRLFREKNLVRELIVDPDRVVFDSNTDSKRFSFNQYFFSV